MALAIAVVMVPLHYSTVVEAPVVASIGVLPSFQSSTAPIAPALGHLGSISSHKTESSLSPLPG